MAEYIPSPTDWVREQVALYESSGDTKATALRDTGLPGIGNWKHVWLLRIRAQEAGFETLLGLLSSAPAA
jgi:hypothetical protein